MHMEKRPVVYFSNQMEMLAEILGEELFLLGGDPFKKRLVLVPHHSLKSYLSSFFARHPKWNISIGVEYKTLLEGLMTLLVKEKEFVFPTQLGISFAIEEDLFSNRAEDDEKIRWLAEELSSVFYEYSLFEPKALEKWLKTKGWKQDLWCRLFSTEGKWKSLAEALLQNRTEGSAIHLFGFAHLPAHFFDFFCKGDPRFYFLSPSKMFWEDLCSDKERIYLEKKMVGNKVRLQVQEQLSFLLKQTHPILANWGKVGRDLLTRFGQKECYLEEAYVDSETSGLLSFLQKSLLDLEDSLEKEEVSFSDNSFLCISASSKLREVEVLLETIQELLFDGRKQPKDIVVFSSNLEEYIPYIHAVFGNAKCPFSYSMHGLPSSFVSEEVKGIEFFFSLIESRFDKESVFDFFSYPSVMKKWGFTLKDLGLFHNWIEKAHVLSGLSSTHRRSCIDKVWPEGVASTSLPEGGSWIEALQRLILGLAIDPGRGFYDELPIHPISIVDWIDAEILGKFMEVILALQEAVKPIYGEEKKTLRGWSLLVKEWLDAFFFKSVKADSLIEGLHSLEQELNSDFLFSFASFKRALKAYFIEKKESFQSSHLQAIKFLPLALGGSYPSKVIYILGCDEESFPKKEIRSCLDETKGYKQTPSLGEQSRYLFLELLLNAREHLIFSYVRISLQDQKAQGPSRLLEELMSYIDLRCFFLESKKKPSLIFTRHHPAIAFSKEYFKLGSPFTCFSPMQFSLAKRYYQAHKKNPVPFFPFWQKKVEIVASHNTPSILEIRKIQDFAKNPVRFYFKEVLGMFFDFIPPKDTEFFVSPLIKSKIKKAAINHSLDEATLLAEKRGEVPLGRFGLLGLQEIEEETLEWKENLASFELTEAQLFSIEFIEGVEKVFLEKGKILSPPLTVDVDGIGKVLLIGKLSFISPRGFLWLGKKKKEEYPILWPSYLLFLCVAKDLGFDEECLLVEEGKKFPIHPKDPKVWLSKYLALYFRSLKEPCPIYPKWFFAFLSKDKEEFKKKIQPTFYESGFEDPYEEWILKRDPLLSVDHIEKEWKEQWLDAFSLFLEEE